MALVQSRSADRMALNPFFSKFGVEKHIKPRKAPWEAPDFMEIVPVDPAIDYQTNHEDEHGKTDEFDTALPDADPVEFAVSTTVSSTLRLILLLMTKNIRALSLNLPLMLPPLRKMLS